MNLRLLLKRFAAALLAAAVAGLPVAIESQEETRPAPVHFALLCDVPYTDDEETWFLALLEALGTDRTLAFVVHDGDFKSGQSPCTDELFNRRHAQFQNVAHPLVFIFGDNEWTDCHREEAGKYDPVERLNKLREIFASGPESLGKRTLRLSRQSSAFPENVRWTYGDVLFVGLNVPGSYNNIAQKQEYKERNAANGAWLKESFRLAATSGARGVLVVIHANPRFQAPLKPNPYRAFLTVLEREVRTFGKPVVLVHGDTHHFRIDKPMRDAQTGQPIENFTRVETFGTPDLGWVKGTVDVSDPEVFRFEPMRAP